MVLSGGCQCGVVRFCVSGPAQFAAVCHCPSCRKSVGASLVGWAMFDGTGLSVDRDTLGMFESSPGVRRSFCAQCGTSLFFEADYLGDLVDITTESFDDPELVRPDSQIWTRHETECVKSLAHMTRYEELPPQA